MERIKQALARARSEAAPAVVPAMKRRNSPVAVLGYDYTQTRTVKLDSRVIARSRIVAVNKNDPHSGIFDVLRTKVLRKMDENGWRTLAITSPMPAAGKTVVSVNLAMSISHQTDRTALLVDLDLRRPSVAKYLGLSGGNSLNDVFQNGTELCQAMVNPGMPRLVVLPTFEPESSPAELLASKTTKALIREMGSRYTNRVVIFDLPPLLYTDDAMTVLPQIDCVLLVVGDGEATKADIEESLCNLPVLNIIGVVLNKAEVARGGYY